MRCTKARIRVPSTSRRRVRSKVNPVTEFDVPQTLSGTGPARIIAMCNQKGGVGKTTTSVNLAAALAEYGRKVLLVDFDPQGAASANLRVNSNDFDTTVYDLLLGSKIEAKDVIVPTAVDGLFVLPANIDLSAAEVQLVGEVARESALARALRPIVDDYDVIIIDCQPSLGLLTVNALVAAHGVVIPLACEFFAIPDLRPHVQTIGRAQDRLNPRLALDAIVPTMYDARTLHAQEVVSRVREAFGDRVTETMIGRTIKFPDATVAAEPILTFAPTHTGSEQYRQLARELIARGVSA